MVFWGSQNLRKCLSGFRESMLTLSFAFGFDVCFEKKPSANSH